MEFAIILTGGKQYKVATGKKVKIEHIAGDEGAVVNFDKVILRSDGKTAELGKPYLESPVKGKIVRQGIHDKMTVFKMKAKKNYKRTLGHKQPFTEVEITSL